MTRFVDPMTAADWSLWRAHVDYIAAKPWASGSKSAREAAPRSPKASREVPLAPSPQHQS